MSARPRWILLALEDLYRPTVSVEFGAWYLASQLAHFGGDTFEALAAYNAGAGPVARWRAADPDLFVEQIDYSETRSYVRQVYLHHAVYRSLLGGGPQQGWSLHRERALVGLTLDESFGVSGLGVAVDDLARGRALVATLFVGGPGADGPLPGERLSLPDPRGG